MARTSGAVALVSMRRGVCKCILRLGGMSWLTARCTRNDFGIRCIIAPSFADIFCNNTMQNGMLPVALPKEVCQELAAEADKGLELEVDLEKQEVRRASGKPAVPFTVDLFRRHCLLNGLDDIALSLQKAAVIEVFESRRSEVWPWLDGFGYKGKIPLNVAKQAKKMEW